MSDNDIRVGVSFPLGQLARALTTAGTHEDPAARQRAEQRVRRWQQVVDGMAAGTLDIGSRTPMRGLPVWVTPEVLHGGFATGTPAAGGALRPDEADRARRWGLPAARRVLFWSWLTDAGLAELGELLDSGRYRVEYAEEAALPVVAWLLRAGAAAATLAGRRLAGSLYARYYDIDYPAVAAIDLAKQCLDEVLRLTARIHHNPRPLSTVKNTAYAWRHMLFFLSLSTGEEQAAFLAHSAQRLAAQPDHVRTRLAPAVTGLGHIVGGGTFDPDGRAGTGRRLLGWTTREHWMLGPSPRGHDSPSPRDRGPWPLPLFGRICLRPPTAAPSFTRSAP
ncbi:hypothetical protein [Micromonospora sp. NBC_01739]|uniref:hypothetical protein n=1 Tax=Micromonospora sp. NBC_01739 TaxID=2975985 RepID=UPI002E15E81D|nr:hypothetical protein OIE53_06880 [Micromonospora sp. NBC_01739]